MKPAEFWASTLAEVTLQIRGQEDLDRRAWQRTAHQMSLLYNVNRGRNQALSWEDFYPYDKERKYVPPPVVTQDLRDEFAQWGKTMKDGPGH